MSFALLPKEIRLQIWTLAYFAQPPRLVTLRTKAHNQGHPVDSFCPRYSPSPAPTIVNVCHESRTEAMYQAQKAGQLVRLPVGRLSDVDEAQQLTEPFYFRFESDILYLPLDDPHVQHHDDYPDNGLLPHFRKAVGCDTTALRNIAITKVIWSGYHDGCLSNSLRDFPNISRMIMTVPLEARDDPAKKAMFVRAARRIVTLYKFDVANLSDDPREAMAVDVDFATIVKGRLEVMSKGKWKDWSDIGIDWIGDGPAQFYTSMSW